MIAENDADADPAMEAVRPVHQPPISTRAAPPKPRRLSRRALALFAGGSAIGLATALVFALSSGGHHVAPQESVAIEHRQGTDLLATAPKDYSAAAEQKAAALGPPPTTAAVQPGGLNARGAGPMRGPSDRTQSPPNREQAAAAQRQRQQRDSARSSKLFASSGETGRAPEPATPAAPATSDARGQPGQEAPTSPGSADPQDRKAAFVAGGARPATINSGRLTAPVERYVVTAGSTIAAALITGLSSDLPGEVVAQVTEDVFDSTTGRTRLIPQGTRLIGSYDAHVTYGQSRALVVWTRLILPDGRSLDLDRLMGTDAAGQSGFADRVNHHTGKLIGAGLLSALFGAGSNLATSGGNNNDIAFAIRDSAGQSVQRTGDKLVEHQLDVQPTITIRPGARVRVLVSRDLVLEPWPGSAG